MNPRAPTLIHLPKADGTDAGDVTQTCGTSTPLVDAVALARALGVHPSHVRRLARLGQLPSYRVGETLRFNPTQVLTHLHRGMAHGSQPQEAARDSGGFAGEVRGAGGSQRTPLDPPRNRNGGGRRASQGRTAGGGGGGGVHAPRRASSSSAGTRRLRRRPEMSASIWSPLQTRAIGPPMAASGDTGHGSRPTCWPP